MDTMDALLQRHSCNKLTEPAPDADQLRFIQQAALRAPDHARLRPWRFLVIAGEGRVQLGDAMVDILLADQPSADADQQQRTRAKPLRAPMIIVAIARIQNHPKVPAMEQVLSAGCAMHAMLLAAFAQGLGAIWRTGPLASDTRLHAKLGLAAGETIIGFLYLGTPALSMPETLRPAVDEHFSHWP
ncbi:MAG TPA: nitroreductase family protein [Pseudomonadales bacterium]|jgi:nitroreductase